MRRQYFRMCLRILWFKYFQNIDVIQWQLSAFPLLHSKYQRLIINSANFISQIVNKYSLKKHFCRCLSVTQFNEVTWSVQKKWPITLGRWSPLDSASKLSKVKVSCLLNKNKLDNRMLLFLFYWTLRTYTRQLLKKY